MPSPAPPLIVIVGPTAVGKTAAAIDLALRLDTDIVNADSRLFYRGMDIGTAKPSSDERRGVRHHLIDILDPNDGVSLATFVDLAHDAIRDVHSRNRVPILVGGTPQYVNALVEGWQIPRVEPDGALRAELDLETIEVLHARLADVDPPAAITHAGNKRRIIRALEVWLKTGTPLSAQQSKGPAPYDALELELWRPRETLYARIDDRARSQLEGGLLEEIRTLIASGADPEAPSFSAIGYRQVMPFLNGEATLDETLARMQFDCHRLVRHQETWWRKNPRLHRVDMDDPSALASLSTAVDEFLARTGFTDAN